jgi:hypothetical protein
MLGIAFMFTLGFFCLFAAGPDKSGRYMYRPRNHARFRRRRR